MTKLIANSHELGKFLINDCHKALQHYIDCPDKNCGGKIAIIPAIHGMSTAATYCPKCQKSVLVREIHC